MRLPHHGALGQRDNWGRLFVSRWLCKSLQRVFRAGACGVHHSATSQLHLEQSAVPIIAWHRHPYLFSWKFIIYDILVSASGDLNAIILLKWDLIGQLLSQLLLWSNFFKCPSIVAIIYHRPADNRHPGSQSNTSYPRLKMTAGKLWLRITALQLVLRNHTAYCICLRTKGQSLHHPLCCLACCTEYPSKINWK